VNVGTGYVHPEVIVADKEAEQVIVGTIESVAVKEIGHEAGFPFTSATETVTP
jgi:hypothetical protein